MCVRVCAQLKQARAEVDGQLAELREEYSHTREEARLANEDLMLARSELAVRAVRTDRLVLVDWRPGPGGCVDRLGPSIH